MTDDFAPFFPISLCALEAGFRLPLSGLGMNVCRHMQINPGQLDPTSWRCITAHVLRSQELNRMPPTLEDFKVVHTSAWAPGEYGLYTIRSTVRSQWCHPEPEPDWR